MIQVTNLKKSFSSRVLFEGLTFSLNSRERMGLVGRNGTGKSTLLKVITDEETYDDGQVISPKGYTIGKLDQHLKFGEGTIVQECMTSLPLVEQDQYYRAEKILMGLGFTEEDFDRKPEEFSGGFQIRIHLTRLLLTQPNLLLLDEPTNYLDVVSMRWLSRFLKSYPGEVILITHDRHFMDKVVTSVGGIFQKKFRKVNGTSKKLYELLETEREHLQNTRENQLKRKKHMQEFVDKYRAKARKASAAQSKLKQMEKMEIVELDEMDETFSFTFRYQPTPGKVLLEAKELTFGYDKNDPLFQNVSFSLAPGEIIGIVGPNGKGKSTLMNLIAGELSTDEGLIRSHPLVKFGHFGQTNVSRLDDKSNIYEEIFSANEDLSQTEVRGICGAMLFSEDDAFKQVNVLSGGEKSRVLLGKILAQPCNILLLDEPSNHLDLESVQVFCEEVKKFEGGVVIISHDEGILDRLCDKLIVFKNGVASEFLGTYKEFLEKIGWDDEDDLDKAKKKKKKKNKPKKSFKQFEGLSASKLNEEIESIESKIDDLEKLDKQYEEKVVELSQQNDIAKLNEFNEIWENIKAAIQESYQKYEDLMEYKEQVEND
jgi:ATP-binding cassette subfamily F protein 3